MLKPIKLDQVLIECPVLLAPLSGITDVPFRQMVLNFGAGIVYSEMIASRTQIQDVKSSLKLIQKAKNQKYSAIQLAGYDPYYVSEAVKLNTNLGADLIDINFGCPAKKITCNYAGSALMHPDNFQLACDILVAAVKATNLPITLKMRLGWDHDMINAPELAKIAEDIGIKMITVHGRTRNQFYNGVSDWEKISLVKQQVKIPVIVNGDIHDYSSASLALEKSGADGIMVGRATCGQPWLLKQLMSMFTVGHITDTMLYCNKIKTMTKHFEEIIEFYGEYAGLRIARKHLHWYKEKLEIDEAFTDIINISPTSQTIKDWILEHL